MNVDGRIAIVTGATKGVGRGVARALAQQGARVFATGRSMPDGPVDQRITGLRCDHRDDAQVEAVFARILAEASTIDVLVTNVWGGYEGMVENGEFSWPLPFWQQPVWRWDAMFAVVAKDYGFTDIDGKSPRPLTIADV